jgi:hypothetical protein
VVAGMTEVVVAGMAEAVVAGKGGGGGDGGSGGEGSGALPISRATTPSPAIPKAASASAALTTVIPDAAAELVRVRSHMAMLNGAF